jgi:hypothetical protein
MCATGVADCDVATTSKAATRSRITLYVAPEELAVMSSDQT